MSFILKLGKPLKDFKKGRQNLDFFLLLFRKLILAIMGLEARRKSRKVYAVV